jgi:subtilisin family serine protease
MILRQLEAQLLTAEGQSIQDARVTAQREGGGEPVEAQLDGDRNLYTLEGLSPGFYQLTVEHPGFEAQSRRVQIHPKPTREIFVLSPPGTPQIRRGRAKVPYSPVPDKLWFRAKEDGPELSELLEKLQLDRETEPVFQGLPPGVLATRRQAAEDQDLRGLRASSQLIEAAGPVLQRDIGQAGLLTMRLAVRFRPETTREEIDHILGDLHLKLLGPVESSAGFFLVEAPDSAGETAVNDLAERLDDHPAVEFAEPVLLQPVVPDCPSPNPFLWPSAWDRHRTRIEPAWQRLEDERGSAKRGGDPDIILAVVDLGILSLGGLPANPDFQQEVTSGEPKVYKFFDFNRDKADNDVVEDAHGVHCAGIATGRSLGAAPNCRLMGLIPHFRDPVRRLQMFTWAAGLARHGTPARIRRGADVFSISVGLDVGPLASELMMKTVKFLTRRGRSGKGCLIFLAAGNEKKEIAVTRPLGASEHAFSCAASTIGREGETTTDYSGLGGVEWCAPSSTAAEGRAHRPPDQMGILTASLNGRCALPSTPWATTRLASDAQAGDNRITVERAHRLVKGAHLALGRPGQSDSETVQITAAPDPQNGAVDIEPLHYPHNRGAEIHAGLRFVGALPPQSAQAQSPPALSFNGLKPGAVLLLWDGSSNDPFESVMPAPVNGNPAMAPFAQLPLNPTVATQIFFRDYHHIDSFGGTSAATALCAGIGALVLSANPRLTWIEARDILRSTAEKIVPSDPGWIDENGTPTTKSGKPPVFNPLFGYGRLDAEAAVAAALSYNFPRDLMIRKTLDDTGERHIRKAVDSPDIWVRSGDPLIDQDAVLESFQTTGPHQPPVYGRRHWVCARIRNRGSEPSYEAWVRFYVASGQRAPFSREEDWEPLNGIGNISEERWEIGTYYIGEVGIDPIGPGQNTTVSFEWPAGLLPPRKTLDGRPWRPTLLVEVTPFDGPLDAKGREIQNNRAWKPLQILSAESSG